MRSAFRVASSLGLLALAACGVFPPRTTPARPPQSVVLVSLDGFRRDYLERYQPPTLTRLAAEGVVAEALLPRFPTLTFPNHYSIVTGLYPEDHGIVANTMYDPVFDATFTLSNGEAANGRWWGGEPIWVTAQRQGVTAASFFWPGSEAEIAGMRPSRWKPYDGRVTYEARVDSVLSWLSLPPADRPRLVTLYFDEPDHTGHDAGPDAPEIRGAILKADSAVARLVAGLAARGLYDAVNLVIVSDHGMAPVSRDRYVFLEDVADTASVRVVFTGSVFMGWSLTGDNATLVAALRRLPHVRAWLRDSIPDRLHFREHRRITPVVAVADAGWTINVRRPPRGPSGGSHGYDNEDLLMHALFIAHGPAFVPGARLPAFPNVDVYPMLARILGIQAAPNSGSLSVLSRAMR